VVPACRSLDCVSVFAPDVDGAARVLAVAAGDGAPGPAPAAAAAPRLAVPDSLDFLGDAAAEQAWELALRVARARGWELVGIEFAPFAEAAAMLYAGPWVTERFLAVGDFIAAHPGEVDPVVARIILGGRDASAVDALRAQARLAELQAAAWSSLAAVDALLVPTTPTIYTHAEIDAEPVARTTALGRHTNFANLLDLCAVALPGPDRADGLPAGVTLLARAGADLRVLELARRWEAADGRVVVAVAGAHLSGQPLNGELRALGAVLLETTRTAAAYRLYALAGTTPPKPGLVRAEAPVGEGIEVELWALGHEGLGRLAAAIPPPLGLGSIALADGRTVTGFLCEAWAVRDAEDITAAGGWRAHLASGRTRTA
jgi:allophanate hydrolase